MLNKVPADFEKSEKLPQNEFYQACENVFKSFDKNNDGLINKEEFTHLLTNTSQYLNFPLKEELVDYIFNLCDQKKRA